MDRLIFPRTNDFQTSAGSRTFVTKVMIRLVLEISARTAEITYRLRNLRYYPTISFCAIMLVGLILTRNSPFTAFLFP